MQILSLPACLIYREEPLCIYFGPYMPFDVLYIDYLSFLNELLCVALLKEYVFFTYVNSMIEITN